MKRIPLLKTSIAAVVLAACAGYAVSTIAAVAGPPFGGPDDVKFAGDLWKALAKQKLVGKNAIVTYPYDGNPPHGKILEYLESVATVKGVTGKVMVKKNYRGEGDAEELEHKVLANRLKYLASVTVMFKRKAGYDPENHDWFWVKYKPDGSLVKNPKGMKMAGRVAKGMSQGCIACHKGASGGDYVFTHDRFAK